MYLNLSNLCPFQIYSIVVSPLRNQDHFASIVRVAFRTISLSQEEKEFLDRLAQNLDISKETYAKHFKRLQIPSHQSPCSSQTRIERLYDLLEWSMPITSKMHMKVPYLEKNSHWAWDLTS